jgi:flagellar biosynthesis protein FlhG
MMEDNVTKLEAVKKESTPTIWAVGGGKGGVGKSIMSSLLGFWLARLGHSTVLVDLDLGGANLHTLMGIKMPPRGLNDFMSGRYDTLEESCIDTELENLRLICGASENLSLANPPFARKLKVVKHLLNLKADHVILDLGAGTSFNVLDFFLSAHRKICVLTPEPVSIHNAYAFIRNAMFRRLSQLATRKTFIHDLIKTAMDPKNDLKVRTVKELFQAIERAKEFEILESLRREIDKIRPALITNMTRGPKEKSVGRVIQIVAENYLMVHLEDLGSVVYDHRIPEMVSNMVPLSRLGLSSEAFVNMYEIVVKLMEEEDKTQTSIVSDVEKSHLLHPESERTSVMKDAVHG